MLAHLGNCLHVAQAQLGAKNAEVVGIRAQLQATLDTLKHERSEMLKMQLDTEIALGPGQPSTSSSALPQAPVSSGSRTAEQTLVLTPRPSIPSPVPTERITRVRLRARQLDSLATAPRCTTTASYRQYKFPRRKSTVASGNAGGV